MIALLQLLVDFDKTNVITTALDNTVYTDESIKQARIFWPKNHTFNFISIYTRARFYKILVRWMVNLIYIFIIRRIILNLPVNTKNTQNTLNNKISSSKSKKKTMGKKNGTKREVQDNGLDLMDNLQLPQQEVNVTSRAERNSFSLRNPKGVSKLKSSSIKSKKFGTRVSLKNSSTGSKFDYNQVQSTGRSVMSSSSINKLTLN